MPPPSQSGQSYCPCGARVARGSPVTTCADCTPLASNDLPPGFWDDPDICAAAASRHIGKLIRAYRMHPSHGRRPLSQGRVGRWFGLSQGQLSRIEGRSAPVDIDKLTRWAKVLGIPATLLWFSLPDDTGDHGEFKVRGRPLTCVFTAVPRARSASPSMTWTIAPSLCAGRRS
jgi:hypothetical protein